MLSRIDDVNLPPKSSGEYDGSFDEVERCYYDQVARLRHALPALVRVYNGWCKCHVALSEHSEEDRARDRIVRQAIEKNLKQHKR